MFVLFSPSFKAAMFRRFLKVATATSSIMNEVYNGGLALEFNVSLLKKIIALVGDYVSETWKKKRKYRENIGEIEIWDLYKKRLTDEGNMPKYFK